MFLRTAEAILPKQFFQSKERGGDYSTRVNGYIMAPVSDIDGVKAIKYDNNGNYDYQGRF